MDAIKFNLRSKFNDKIEYICCPQNTIGAVNSYTNFTVYLYINNQYRKRYENVLASGYFDLNKQINQLYNNF